MSRSPVLQMTLRIDSRAMRQLELRSIFQESMMLDVHSFTFLPRSEDSISFLYFAAMKARLRVQDTQREPAPTWPQSEARVIAIGSYSTQHMTVSAEGTLRAAAIRFSTHATSIRGCTLFVGKHSNARWGFTSQRRICLD